MEALLEGDSQVVVWWGTSVECVSALARLEREGQLSARDFKMAQQRLRSLGELWSEIQPQAAVRARAEQLLRLHPLRAADALQLAAALTLAGEDRSGVGFVCFDEPLTRAAVREGFTLEGGRLA
jgi:predicted nucleic acid-binding protein